MRTLGSLGAALALVIVTACGDSRDPAAPDTTHVGTYALLTINGQPLPFTLAEEGEARLVVTSGSVELRGDGTFSDLAALELSGFGEAVMETDTVRGTYARSGSTISLNASDGDSYTMEFSGGNTLTQSVPGLVIVYRK